MGRATTSLCVTQVLLGTTARLLERRDEQDPINVGVIVGLSGAYQARNASQSPPFELFFDATKVEKQLPTRTAKSDDALTKNNLVAYFRNRPVLCARSHQRPVSHICPV